MSEGELTYMDCWHYIAPLIPITDDKMTHELYVMIFHALKVADEEDRKKKKGKRGETKV